MALADCVYRESCHPKGPLLTATSYHTQLVIDSLVWNGWALIGRNPAGSAFHSYEGETLWSHFARALIQAVAARLWMPNAPKRKWWPGQFQEVGGEKCCEGEGGGEAKQEEEGVMVDQWRSYEAVKRNMTPGHFPRCRALRKVRLAGPQGALTLESVASVVDWPELSSENITRSEEAKADAQVERRQYRLSVFPLGQKGADCHRLVSGGSLHCFCGL